MQTYKMEQDVGKVDTPMIPASAAKTMFELDVLTQQATQNKKSGLSESLRHLSITDTEHENYWMTQVPEYFDLMDVRKPPEMYVSDKLQ